MHGVSEQDEASPIKHPPCGMGTVMVWFVSDGRQGVLAAVAWGWDARVGESAPRPPMIVPAIASPTMTRTAAVTRRARWRVGRIRER